MAVIAGGGAAAGVALALVVTSPDLQWSRSASTQPAAEQQRAHGGNPPPAQTAACWVMAAAASHCGFMLYVMCHQQQNQFYSLRKSPGRSNKRLHQTLYPLDLALSCAEPGPTHDWENQKFALSLSIMLNINLQCAQTAGKMKDKIGHTFY